MSKIYLKNKKTKKNYKKNEFMKFMDKKYGDECGKIKAYKSCKKDCSITTSEQIKKISIKYRSKIKKSIVKCFKCENIQKTNAKAEVRKIMNNKYKCKHCKKTKQLMKELADKLQPLIKKDIVDKCTKCLTKKKAKFNFKDYKKMAKFFKLVC